MQLIKWEPFNEVDRFFDDFPTVSVPKLGLDLAVDLYKEKGNIIASMNLPGINPEKVDISVEDNVLKISGSREEEKEEKNKHYYSKEIRRGAFERSVRLPNAVDKTKVDAEYVNGTLRVTMPVIEKKKESTVKIKVRK